MELLRKGIIFVLVLDLSEAYDMVLKTLRLAKLEKLLPSNLVRQLKVFIKTVTAKVSGHNGDNDSNAPRANSGGLYSKSS